MRIVTSASRLRSADCGSRTRRPGLRGVAAKQLFVNLAGAPGRDLNRQILPRKARRAPRQLAPERLIFDQFRKPGREVGTVSGGEQQAALVLADQLGSAADARADRRA